ncbi:MAG: hypothetical protein M3342_15945, partial [Bacteroidota bacterium]|nr:hypothetical protein [Bacteroidota bacterium]
EVLFDFDQIEKLLILPALEKVALAGGTTGNIFEAGDIREDMFSLLLLADVVIADITIHNANVFYELGIRHALRDKKTILIKCPGFDETPFDILGYRYVSYEKDDPAKALPDLMRTLQETMLANRSDSPVFKMLPKLEVQDTERFLAVPPAFGEEVELAYAGNQMGKLALLAAETKGFPWEIPALRMVGEMQFRLKDFEDAKLTWERVRNRNTADPEANDRLATIYQRMAEGIMEEDQNNGWDLLAQSDLAIKRLLENSTHFDKSKRAEIYSLRARNAKTRWLYTWRDAPDENRREKALQSAFLNDAYEDYLRGYYEDLNHFYSGINALGLLTVIISLAEAQPNIWALEYDTDEDAKAALKELKVQQQKLRGIVQASIEAEKKRLEREGQSDAWLNMTEADLACLTSNRPQRVSSLYTKVIQEANNLNFDAAKRQLLIYEQLGVLPDNVQAALSAFTQAAAPDTGTKRHYLLFTGHMIDQPGRKEPRFPPDKEPAARAAIKAAVQQEMAKIEVPVTGISGGACGGDILFHEVCEELGIPTELYLALPREQFLVESVQFAGPQWVERFDRLYKKLPKKVLTQSKELPAWLQSKPNYSIWERNNQWMLYNALDCGGLRMSLIALWDGKGGDGPGGTAHMVEVAQGRGAKAMIIDIKEL